MTIPNELKIQLESKQDFVFLKGELSNFLSSSNSQVSKELCDKFTEEVFSIIANNVQIEGVDYDKLNAEDEIAPIDATLQSHYEQLQLETEDLLVRVTEQRRTCPQLLRDKFTDSVINAKEIINRNVETTSQSGPLVNITPESPTPFSKLTDTNMDNMIHELKRLEALDDTLPELVAKLGRAKTVLTDPSLLNTQAYGIDSTNGVTAERRQTYFVTPGTKITQDNLNDIFNRQRRIARQQDLAIKLFSQILWFSFILMVLCINSLILFLVPTIQSMIGSGSSCRTNQLIQWACYSEKFNSMVEQVFV